jgi:acyl transferase domain-containing protein
MGREAYPCRLFVISDHTAMWHVSPTSLSGNKRAAPVVWVFTGQGAQWAQMGKEIIQEHPLVSRRIDELDAILARLPEPPLWTIRGGSIISPA